MMMIPLVIVFLVNLYFYVEQVAYMKRLKEQVVAENPANMGFAQELITVGRRVGWGEAYFMLMGTLLAFGGFLAWQGK